jgi:hypothetical protein
MEHQGVFCVVPDELILLIEGLKRSSFVVGANGVAVHIANARSVVVVVPTILEGFLGKFC